MAVPITLESTRKTALICRLRDEDGMDWRAIGRAVGLTQTAARARWLRAKGEPRTRAAIRKETAAKLRGLREENRRLKAMIVRIRAILEDV